VYTLAVACRSADACQRRAALSALDQIGFGAGTGANATPVSIGAFKARLQKANPDRKKDVSEFESLMQMNAPPPKKRPALVLPYASGKVAPLDRF
jgi:hypothetical protein